MTALWSGSFYNVLHVYCLPTHTHIFLCCLTSCISAHPACTVSIRKSEEGGGRENGFWRAGKERRGKGDRRRCSHTEFEYVNFGGWGKKDEEEEEEEEKRRRKR